MKILTGTIILSMFCLVTSMAEPVVVKPSEKLGMSDTVMQLPALCDTLQADTVKISIPGVMQESSWHYEPLLEMPDPSVQGWWRGFHDATLDSLISMAVRNNNNVSIAARRIEISKLSLSQARSAYYPTIAVQAGWTKDRTSAYMAKRRSYDSQADYFTLGLDANWEIDVFGRIRKQSHLREADLNISRADYSAALVSLCAQLTEDYVQLRVAQAQLEVARRLSVSQQEVLRVATVRHECTLASGLDVSQAKSVCLATQAAVPTLQIIVDQSINAIAVLTGVPATQLRPQLIEDKPIPIYSMPLDVEITPELLRRRPDIQAAEQQVAAYAAQVGIAKKDFLPTLSLNASIGSASHSLGNLFRHDALTYSVQPTLSWTLFSGLSRKYALAEARQQMMVGIDEYNYTLQQAAAEVDNALSSYRNSLRRIGLLSEVLGESLKSFDYALDQYKQGLTPFLNVVNAQIDVLNYNNQLVEERGNSQNAVIQLYKALGGGW